MAFGPKICASCGSNDDVQEHCLVSTLYGGKLLPTIFLCGICHAATHSMKWRANHKLLTLEGLRRAKERGVVLGNPQFLKRGNIESARRGREIIIARADSRASKILPIIKELKSSGVSSLTHIATVLTQMGVRTPNGRNVWRAQQVKRGNCSPRLGGGFFG
jgi:hypothetical protein